MFPRISEGDKQVEPDFDYHEFIAKHGGASISRFASGEVIYAQGDPADALYYIIEGSVRVTVLSEHGKEGGLAMLGRGDFFGEACLSGRSARTSTLTATSPSEIVRFNKDVVTQALSDDAAFCHSFCRFILQRTERLKEDLIDQLFHSSEKRLARLLLTLAHEIDGKSYLITIPITQETLAGMVGTTRSRISQFMTKFRKLGYIEYDGAIRVHKSLLNIILNDGNDELDR
jgi:CRP/FNR family cyclic AMP-dependent transcriptional regulator